MILFSELNWGFWLFAPASPRKLNKHGEWSRRNLQEHAERLKQNGFDDIDLLKQTDHEEIEEMILLIGMEKKGHILKLKKCLMGLKAPLKQPAP